MTDKLRSPSPSNRLRTATLMAFGLLAVPAPTATAATIKAHAQHTPSNFLSKEFSGLQKVVNDWKTQFTSSSAGQFLNRFTLTNPDGTLKSQYFAQLFAGKERHPVALPRLNSPRAAAILNHQARLLAQAEARHAAAAIATPSRSSAFMVMTPPGSNSRNQGRGGVAAHTLGAGDGSTPSSSGAAPEVLAVPEPSAVVSVLALFGTAGGWWRLRLVKPRALS